MHPVFNWIATLVGHGRSKKDTVFLFLFCISTTETTRYILYDTMLIERTTENQQFLIVSERVLCIGHNSKSIIESSRLESCSVYLMNPLRGLLYISGLVMQLFYAYHVREPPSPKTIFKITKILNKGKLSTQIAIITKLIQPHTMWMQLFCVALNCIFFAVCVKWRKEELPRNK